MNNDNIETIETIETIEGITGEWRVVKTKSEVTEGQYVRFNDSFDKHGYKNRMIAKRMNDFMGAVFVNGQLQYSSNIFWDGWEKTEAFFPITIKRGVVRSVIELSEEEKFLIGIML